MVITTEKLKQDRTGSIINECYSGGQWNECYSECRGKSREAKKEPGLGDLLFALVIHASYTF